LVRGKEQYHECRGLKGWLLVKAFPRTRAATVSICQYGPTDRDRGRALALLKRIHDGEDEPVPALLRDLVLGVRELTGAAWITARMKDPQVAAFLALDLMPEPPTSAELDAVLAGVLRSRFTALSDPWLAERRRPLAGLPVHGRWAMAAGR
jgi:hypothetical protein